MRARYKRRTLCVLLCGFAALGAASGCGSDASGESSRAYVALLEELDRAAKSGGAIRAAKRAQRLEVPIEKEMVRSFCLLNWQGKINAEVWKYDKYGYVVGRIRAFAAYGPEERFAPETETALEQLESIIDLNELDSERARAYTKACYR